MREIVFTLFASLFAFTACEQPAPNGLMPIKGTSVNLLVTGEAIVTPDIAEVTGGIEAKGVSSKEALNIQNTKMSNIISSLKTLGIDEKDIANEQVNLNPIYTWTAKGGQKITGYQAVNIIKIKVRDKQKISQVLDAMVRDGTNRIDGVVFKMENKDAPAQMARKDALERANARAEAYAKSAGMKVYKIVAINESSSNIANPGAPIMYDYKVAYPQSNRVVETEMAPTQPIAQGQIESQVTLNVTYEFRK